MERTQLKVGHRALCGCPVTAIDADGFTISHRAECNLAGVERVTAYLGQAVCSSPDGVPAVLRIDLPYPHQMPGWGHSLGMC